MTTQLDRDAGAAAAQEQVDERDRDAVVGATSREELEGGVRARAEVDAVATRTAEITPPAECVVNPEGYNAALEASALAPMPLSLLDGLPETVKLVEDLAEAGHYVLAHTNQRLHENEVETSQEHAWRAEQVAQQRGLVEIEREQRRSCILLAIIFMVEALVMTASSAAYFGINGYPSVSAIPASLIVQVISVAAPLTIAAAVLTVIMRDLIRKLAAGRGVLIALLCIGIIVTIVFAGGIGVFRVVASTNDDAVTAGSSLAGMVAVLALTLVSSVLAAVLVGRLHERLTALKQEIEEVRRTDERHAFVLKILSEERLALLDERAHLVAIAARPFALRAQFERDVLLVRRRIGNEAAVIEARVRRALLAFDRRQQVPASRRPGVESRLRNGKAHWTANGIIASTIITLMTLSSASCVEPAPNGTTCVCDGTGPIPACTPAVLEAGFMEWIGRAWGIPGSEFIVVLTGGSYATTDLIAVATVPSVVGADPRMERVRFIDQALERVREIEIPRDGPDNRKSSSDLLAALAVASRHAREQRDQRHALVVASDGMIISGRVNAERTMPSASDIEDEIDRVGFDIDLSGFSDITICGFTHAGLTPDQANKRDSFWKALVHALGGKAITPRGSCNGTNGRSTMSKNRL